MEEKKSGVPAEHGMPVEIAIDLLERLLKNNGKVSLYFWLETLIQEENPEYRDSIEKLYTEAIRMAVSTLKALDNKATMIENLDLLETRHSSHANKYDIPNN